MLHKSAIEEQVYNINKLATRVGIVYIIKRLIIIGLIIWAYVAWHDEIRENGFKGVIDKMWNGQGNKNYICSGNK